MQAWWGAFPPEVAGTTSPCVLSELRMTELVPRFLGAQPLAAEQAREALIGFLAECSRTLPCTKMPNSPPDFCCSNRRGQLKSLTASLPFFLCLQLASHLPPV